MPNHDDNEMMEYFAKHIDKAAFANQIQNYVKGGKQSLFKEKKTEQEYKQDIINLLKERKRNGL